MLNDRLSEHPLASFVDYIASEVCFISVSGNNAFRLQWCHKIEESGGKLASLVHPPAYISPKAKIADGVVVLLHAVVNTGTVVKEGSIINIGAIVDHDCILKSGVHIAPVRFSREKTICRVVKKSNQASSWSELR